MKLIVRWARWFGLARAVCIVLLFALVPLRARRPAAARGSAAAHVRSVSGAAPARADRAARRHRRHRRGEPEGDRAMAMAADRGGRSRHPAARRSALSPSASTSCSPSPTACRRPLPPASFRGLDAETREKLAGLPSNDEVLAEAIKQAARGRRPGRLGDASAAHRRQRWRCRPASPSRGPIRAPFLVKFAGCCATFRRSSRPPPAAGCSQSIPERDGIVRRVPVVMDGARYAGAFAVHGDAPRRHRRRRHPRCAPTKPA